MKIQKELIEKFKKEIEKRITNDDILTIRIEGNPREGMSASALRIGKYIDNKKGENK